MQKYLNFKNCPNLLKWICYIVFINKKTQTHCICFEQLRLKPKILFSEMEFKKFKVFGQSGQPIIPVMFTG
jgi:hypothetical protein